MLRMKNKRGLWVDDRGVVTIVIAIIIILLVTLISVAYVRIANREQRQALDRQLSAQAQYAAEAGINDAVKAIKNNPSFTSDKGTCQPYDSTDTTKPAELRGTSSSQVGSTSGVEYTCLLIKQAITEIKYEPVTIERAQIFPVRTDSNIATLRIAWQAHSGDRRYKDSDYNPRLSSDPCRIADFPKIDDWDCPVGMLRVDVVPLPATFTHTTLIDSTNTFFLRPVDNTAEVDTAATDVSKRSIAYTAVLAEQGNDVSVRCKANDALYVPRDCVFNLNVASLNASNFYVRVSAFYEQANVSVQAFSSSSTALPIIGSQIEVDATGRAGDIYKRIQARVPLTNSYDWPDYVVRSMDNLCKQFTIAPGSAPNDKGGCGLN